MNPAFIRSMSPVTKPSKCLDIDERIEKVFYLYEKHGGVNYVGENVTQLQHAQQV